MLHVDIGSEALLNLAKSLASRGRGIDLAIAHALNMVGENVVEEVIHSIVEQTGLTEEAARRNVIVTRATRNRLSFNINASKALIDEPASRPMKGRTFTRRPNDYFRQSELVNIVTMGDDRVCQICQDLEAHGPYTIEEARAQIPAHPNCRCLVQTYRTRRELPVQFRKGQRVQISTVSVDQLAKTLKDQVLLSLKAK